MRGYLTTVLATCLLLLFAVALFNYRVDPYLLFHHRDGDSGTLSRIDQFYNMRVYKPYHVGHKSPQNIIVGTSRSATLWPATANWRSKDFYNFAMPGMTLFEMNRSVRHAQAVRPLSHLLVGLDYQAFVRSSPRYRPGFETSRLLDGADDRYSARHIGRWLTDLHTFLFSFAMTAESISAAYGTVPVPRTYYPNGVWVDSSKKLVGRGAYIFVGKSAVSAVESSRLGPEESLAQFRQMLRYCHQNDIGVSLFLTPTHVFFVDLWFRISTEQLWRDTHRKMVAINEAVARELGREPFPLWAFGDEAGVVDEPIYRTRDIDKAWFLDGVHSSERLAVRMMSTIQGENQRAFGRRLSRENIGGYLDSVDTLRARFLRQNAAEVRELHEAIGLDRNPLNRAAGE